MAKEIGYFDFDSTNGYVTDAYVCEIKSVEVNDMILQCECCGRDLTTWLSVNYIDEFEQEIEEIYGKSCFKKISRKSSTIFI